MDVPAGVTQEEGHTGFLIYFLSAVRALVFLARRIQPLFLSLVDREVEFYFYFLFFIFFVRKIPFIGIELTSQPTCQKVTRLPLSYRDDRLTSTRYLILKAKGARSTFFFFKGHERTVWDAQKVGGLDAFRTDCQLKEPKKKSVYFCGIYKGFKKAETVIHLKVDEVFEQQ